MTFLILILFISSQSFAEYSTVKALPYPGETQFFSFLESAGQVTRSGFYKSPGQNWKTIPAEKPPVQIKNWNLYFNGRIKGSLGNLLANAELCEMQGSCPLTRKVPALKDIWHKFADWDLPQYALQADAFIGMRPFLITTQMRLSDPDQWAPFDQSNLSAPERKKLQEAFNETFRPSEWLRDLKTDGPCKAKNLSEFFLTELTDKRPHSFRSKAGSMILARRGNFSVPEPYGCRLIPTKQGFGDSEFGYLIYPKITLFVFFLQPGKDAIFLGHDLTMVDTADLDGDGKSEIIMTSFHGYELMNHEGNKEATLSIHNLP